MRLFRWVCSKTSKIGGGSIILEICRVNIYGKVSFCCINGDQWMQHLRKVISLLFGNATGGGLKLP